MKLIIEFSGYIYVNENSKFMWFGEGNSQPAIISTKEYLALDAATRSCYIIESMSDALREADDGQYVDINYCLEDDGDPND